MGAVCSLTTSAVSFGSCDPIGANASTALNANGSISDTGSNGLAGTIALDQGLDPTGGSTALPERQMHAQSHVRYPLSIPQAHGHVRLDFRWATAPSTIQIPSASHSYTVKWPGIAGTTFISNIAVATSKPKPATVHSIADNLD